MWYYKNYRNAILGKDSTTVVQQILLSSNENYENYTIFFSLSSMNKVKSHIQANECYKDSIPENKGKAGKQAASNREVMSDESNGEMISNGVFQLIWKCFSFNFSHLVLLRMLKVVSTYCRIIVTKVASLSKIIILSIS